MCGTIGLMNPKSLRALEYSKILDKLAAHSSFSAGRDLALALQPSTDFDEVTRRQRETSEAKDLLARRGNVTVGGARDVRPQARQARVGAILQPQDFLAIRDTLVAARTLRNTISRLADQLPLLNDTARRLEDCPRLVEAIDQVFNDAGEIVDHATPRLARIRHDLLAAEDRLRTRLDRLIASPEARKYLQEPLITQREGRYVIPLKAEFKGRIPGLIHDTSASGATLFVEPLAVVELGNRVRELQLEEQREIERILRELSNHVSTCADHIRQTVEALAALDLALAKANYSFALKAVEPELWPLQSSRGAEETWGRGHTETRGRGESPYPRVSASPRLPVSPTFHYVQARHPLLDPATVVPIDVHIGKDFRILVITGPNTGGKTVALKTVGLLTLMAQSGLHIPAQEGSGLTVFSGVYADIGDEQSIEQNLSTFSSHLTNIIDTLRQADARALVLLDELGAGTDPVEGSALARAILESLLERRITTLATTHYSELKAFAHATPGVQNASVEFDVETLSPTYELTIGLPGRSNAFAIAQRLGLQWPVLERAKHWLSESDLRIEDMLSEIRAARQEAVAARQTAEESRRTVGQAERELQARLAAVEAERREILNQARQQAGQELEAVREEIRRLRRQLDQARSREAFTQALQEVEALREAVEPLPSPPRPAPVDGPREVQVGDTVWVESLKAQAQVIGLSNGQAEIALGAFRAKVPIESLEIRSPSLVTEPEVRVTTTRPVDVPLELNVIGQRAEEAVRQVENYLDQAALAGLARVRIVHGKGTGALRRAIRELLDKHPLVTSHRPGDRYEGEEGATVVELAGQ